MGAVQCARGRPPKSRPVGIRGTRRPVRLSRSAVSSLSLRVSRRMREAGSLGGHGNRNGGRSDRGCSYRVEIFSYAAAANTTVQTTNRATSPTRGAILPRRPLVLRRSSCSSCTQRVLGEGGCIAGHTSSWNHSTETHIRISSKACLLHKPYKHAVADCTSE